MALLVAEQLEKRYGTEIIFQNVSLKLQPGESVSLIGPSGSGKTTLLFLLGLLAQPTAGQLWLDGVLTNSLSDREKSALRNEKIGFVLQNSHLIGTLSVLDNVLCPTFFAKKSPARLAKAKELLALMGLEHRMHHLPSQLSLGQRRRVALARALVMEPQLILADEPTNDLDPERASQVADFLFSLPKKGISLVLVTHDPSLAARAQWVYRLENKKLIPETRDWDNTTGAVAGPSECR